MDTQIGPVPMVMTAAASRARRFHHRRHELLRLFVDGRGRNPPRLPSPGKQLLRRQSVPTGDLRNHRAWNKCFFDDPGLGFFRKLPAPASSGDNLEPAHLNQLRLKRMVKRRHKPISDSQIEAPDESQSLRVYLTFGCNWPIVLQKSKFAGRRVFRENPEREPVADSYRLNRAIENTDEFNARR
jgi:hypothetical protein